MIPVANTFYSGAGLMEIGLSNAGIKLGQSFEIDPACCATARANHAHQIVQCDIELKLALEDKPSDAMVATYPCNRYANVSAIHGRRTGDSHFLHFLRHVVLRRPEIYVIENVPGMRKFPVVMEAMTRLPDYYVHVVCPVASSLWLPQVRDRLIIFGSRRRFQWRLPASSRRRVSLKEILERDPTPRLPKYIYKRIRGGYRDLPIISDPKKGDLAPTCVAHYSKDLSTRLVVDKRFRHGVRPYTVREYARLQGLPDSFEFKCAESKAYQMIGNGVSVPVGRWIGRELLRYFQN